MTTNPLKRARVDSSSEAALAENPWATRHPDFWFSDGSIILKVQNTMFRVHKTTLASHSTVFADMFGVPQPTDQDAIEGCAVIEVPQDRAADFEQLLKAIYDPIHAELVIRDDSPMAFCEITGILRLSTKYDIPILRRRSIHHLKNTFSDKREHFKWGHFEKSIHSDEDIVEALFLCQECNVLTPLPFIYYRLAYGNLEEALPLIMKLPTRETQICFLGREKLIAAMKDVFPFLFNPKPSSKCLKLADCRTTLFRVQQGFFSTNRYRRQYVLDDILRVIARSDFCHSCFAEYESHAVTTSQRIWEELPGYFGLASWEELRRST